MRGMIPAQAPYEGGEPTRRKGSYSEELVRIDDVEIVRWGNEDVGLRHDGHNGCHMEPSIHAGNTSINQAVPAPVS